MSRSSEFGDVPLIADPRVVAVPIRDCGEPLVDLRELDGVAIDERKRDAAGVWLHARAGVAERLAAVASSCPDGIRLLLVEAYRPLEVQRGYFDEYCAWLREEHPEWDDATVRLRASAYVAPPDVDPPHSTGGAIDLTLVADEGSELDLGTVMNASPEASGGACYTDAPGISSTARTNRDLLARLLTSRGFVNYGTEWWHWSYGDRYWAFVSGRPYAIYGSTEPE
jgi:D-alanyl-D-alanine dipeptidase